MRPYGSRRPDGTRPALRRDAGAGVHHAQHRPEPRRGAGLLGGVRDHRRRRLLVPTHRGSAGVRAEPVGMTSFPAFTTR